MDFEKFHKQAPKKKKTKSETLGCLAEVKCHFFFFKDSRLKS